MQEISGLGTPSLGLDNHLVIYSPSKVAGPQQDMASLLKEHSQEIKSFGLQVLSLDP